MPTDEQTQYTLTGAVTMVQVAPDTVIQWKIADGTFVTLPGTELVMLAQAVATHVQNCFGVEATLATGIQASPPTITTRAEIDEAYAAIVTTINAPSPGMSSAAQMDGVAAVDFRSA
jgi:hypothetical protein